MQSADVPASAGVRVISSVEGASAHFRSDSRAATCANSSSQPKKHPHFRPLLRASCIKKQRNASHSQSVMVASAVPSGRGDQINSVRRAWRCEQLNAAGLSFVGNR